MRRPTIETVTRSSGHKFQVFRYSKHQRIKMPIPSDEAIKAAIRARDAAILAQERALEVEAA